ncbi:MAG TPA: MarR family transcriptional regulator [Gemmatimonadales bacterium]|jgi:MarR family 2-MHQ and catechol resistance regulon transcriptional repressor|nr:MarR family transcriptional regulator [Gemmatimonadales bacterium]
MARNEAGRDQALELWVVLARATNAVSRHARADVARHGLADAEFGVLEVLFHKGPLRVCEAQRRILLQSGSTAYVVDKLVRKKLVRRTPNPRDKRGTLLVLTPRGRQLMTRIFPGHAEVIRRAMGALSKRELKRAAELVRKLGLGAATVPDETPT